MAAAKKQTKKDLENKIAKLEAKINQLATQLESEPAETKPAETPKPQEAPKPAETTAQPPATVQEALENAYRTAPTSSFHDYRAKVTGYAPAPNRYFVRLTAPVGKVSTSDWNAQKAKVTGYTQPSDQYFATRARLAYHPPDKTFGSFSGANLSVEGVLSKLTDFDHMFRDFCAKTGKHRCCPCQKNTGDTVIRCLVPKNGKQEYSLRWESPLRITAVLCDQVVADAL